jgi:APA family basic amino acid/polyamine antiporter
LSANMLHTPRITFAMGERGDFPAFFAAIHPRFRTPHLSILTFAFLLLLFSVGGNFRWNASLSAISRLFMYGAVVAALPVLRRKFPRGGTFRLPAGMFFAGLGLSFMIVLLAQMHGTEFIVTSITIAIALLNWLWARDRELGIAHES